MACLDSSIFLGSRAMCAGSGSQPLYFHAISIVPKQPFAAPGNMNSEYDSAQAMLCDEERYKDYSDIDLDTHSFIYSPNRSRFLRPLFILLSLIATIVPILFFTTTNHLVSYSHPKFDQCGITAEEARSRGCVFEITGFTWLPKECHDPATEEEFVNFLSEKNIEIYRYYNASEVVPIEEARRGDGPGFYRQQYHVTHCLFLLKKLHRAYASSNILDGQIMPTHHTEHCVGQVLEGPEIRKDEIQFSYTKFPYCGKPGGYNVAWKKGTGAVGWKDS